MATIEKSFLDYPGLQRYDNKIKEYTNTIIQQITPVYESATHTLKFLEGSNVTVDDDELIFTLH